jgi:hypothetical protein
MLCFVLDIARPWSRSYAYSMSWSKRAVTSSRSWGEIAMFGFWGEVENSLDSVLALMLVMIRQSQNKDFSEGSQDSIPANGGDGRDVGYFEAARAAGLLGKAFW